MEHSWKILLFAGLVSRFGSNEITLSLNERTLTAAQLKTVIIEKFSEHESLVRSSFFAANNKYCKDDSLLSQDMEIALLPPVSGGDGQLEQSVSLYCISEDAININEVANKVISAAHGATITFIGTTREFTEGQKTVYLHYEAYIPMAIASLKQIGEEVFERFNGANCAITHRIGKVDLAEISVVIAVSAPHREECYQASRYAIERLKQIVPIWKKEIWEDGSEWKGHQQGPWTPISDLF